MHDGEWWQVVAGTGGDKNEKVYQPISRFPKFGLTRPQKFFPSTTQFIMSENFWVEKFFELGPHDKLFRNFF